MERNNTSQEERISELERTVRTMRAILVLLLLAIVGAFGVGFRPGDADVIRARSFVVVNDSGHSVAKLGSDRRGGFVWINSPENIAFPKILLSVGSDTAGSISVFRADAGTVWQTP